MKRSLNDNETLDPAEQEFIPVLLESVGLHSFTDVELYMKAGKSFFLMKPKGRSMDSLMLQKYRGAVTHLYIHTRDQELYFHELNKNVSQIVKSSGVSVKAKAAVLTDCAVGLVGELFDDPSNPRTISQSKELTRDMLTLIGSSQHAFLHLVELSSHDHYTYSHSIGVAAYSLALAAAMKTFTPDQIVDIGIAGLLHDIGKCMVDPAIINKKGPLNADEWAIMKKHPQYGGEILSRHKNLNPIVKLSAEGHHENLDGTGYPRGRKAAELVPAVKIISLADAFSALTTKRSYSEPRDTMSAFMLIKDNINKKFDPALFQQFLMLFYDPKKKQEAA